MLEGIGSRHNSAAWCRWGNHGTSQEGVSGRAALLQLWRAAIRRLRAGSRLISGCILQLLGLIPHLGWFWLMHFKKINRRSQESNLPFWKDKSISQQFGIKVKKNLFVSLPDVLGMLKSGPTSRLTRNRSRAEGKDPGGTRGCGSPDLPPCAGADLAELLDPDTAPSGTDVRGRKDAVSCPKGLQQPQTHIKQQLY